MRHETPRELSAPKAFALALGLALTVNSIFLYALNDKLIRSVPSASSHTHSQVGLMAVTK